MTFAATLATGLVLAAVTFAPAATQHVAARLVWIALGAVAVIHAAAHLLGGRGKVSGKSRGRDGPGGDGIGQAGRASGSGRLPGWCGPVPVVIHVRIGRGTKGRARKGG